MTRRCGLEVNECRPTGILVDVDGVVLGRHEAMGCPTSTGYGKHRPRLPQTFELC